MKSYNTIVTENKISKLYNYLLSDNLKDKTKDFLQKCSQEIDEYKEIGSILKEYNQTGKLSKEDKKKVITQLIDTLKIGTSGAVFLLPFGSIIIIALVKIGKKYNINFLPTSWNVNENKQISILNDIKIGQSISYIQQKFKTNNVNLNEQDKDGNTSLHHAVSQGLLFAVELLIEYGADLEIKNKKQVTPIFNTVIDPSDRKYNIKVYELLRDSGANINIKDRNGVTMLTYMLQYEPDADLYYILEEDSDWNIIIGGVDFLEKISYHYRETIIQKYPEKYKKYLKKKKALNFNL